MKTLTASTLALTLAAGTAGTAMADNHGDDAKKMDDGQMTTEAQAEEQAQIDDTKTGTAAKADAEQRQAMSADEMLQNRDSLIRTRDITGGEIFTANAASDEGWDASTTHEAVADDWTQIGEIEDVVLTRDGQFAGVVAEVGGFMDIADKHVMIPIKDVNLVAVDDQDYAYVTRLSEEELEQMEGMDEGFWN